MQSSNPVTLRELLGDLSSELYALGAQTAALARAELRAASATLKLSLLLGAVGLLLAVAGSLVLLTALVLIAIALGMPPWAAAVSVGLVLCAGGGLAVWLCVARLRG